MVLEERRAVVNLALDDEPRLGPSIVRLELVERDLAVDASLGHDDLRLLRSDGLPGPSSELVFVRRLLVEGRVGRIETRVFKPLHPPAWLQARHRRVLEAKDGVARLVLRAVNGNAEPPVAAGAKGVRAQHWESEKREDRLHHPGRAARVRNARVSAVFEQWL